ncbi:DNA-formamidopyrimidine glycosylase [Candidatus Protochlamydia amoebophila]|uniref:Formamidopyrimidine-DNA glycosylase n=1 Tax=Candidatus Protochlamydia amoebophila TaxID=362787 RepID=A0A0C1HBJ4_9BACT|nr:DNA-formamidopyrimidine glycosylase [Candidatus Protochlamydia amoebophila]KIC72158.1 Formamidopyrimidine-DNA glycosylase [Candidatus Protochlamydia amoebophila]
MPELPEVHTIVQDLKQSRLIGKKIISTEIFWPKTLAVPTPEIFCQQVQGQSIQNVDRRGKYIIFQLSNQMFLIVHLRMTGRFQFVTSQTPTSPYVRIQFNFENDDQLRFHDTRKFGRWYLVSDVEEIIGHLGPEPLLSSFTFELFEDMMKNRKTLLKSLLLDQSFIVGLGNIYVDEALWEAKLHPLIPANQINLKHLKILYHSIKYVLEKGIQARGTTLGPGRTHYYRLDGSKGEHQTLLNVFRKTGHPCPRCGHLIERLIVAQRGTHICPICQKK